MNSLRAELERAMRPSLSRAQVEQKVLLWRPGLDRFA
jgi:hypothetical protein